jgi:hypothetical protein
VDTKTNHFDNYCFLEDLSKQSVDTVKNL